MEKVAHDVVVVPFRPRTERGGKVMTGGGRGEGRGGGNKLLERLFLYLFPSLLC